MIRLPKNKIINIVVMIFIFGVAAIMFSTIDELKPTRDELTILFNTSFDSCTLTKVEKRKYPGRGNYSVFYTDCTSDYYPILLEKNINSDNYDLFKENSKLTKASNSIDLLLTDSNGVHKLKIRKPEDEDDRGFASKVALIAMAISVTLIIISPNRLFEKKD